MSRIYFSSIAANVWFLLTLPLNSLIGKHIKPTKVNELVVNNTKLTSPDEIFIYLFIYLTLPINIYKENTQKHIWTFGRKHATAFVIYSGPYRKIATNSK